MPAGTVHLSVPVDRRWQLTVDGESVTSRPAFGITMAFDVERAGTASLAYETSFRYRAVLLVQLLVWAVVAVAATSVRFRRPRLRQRALLTMVARTGVHHGSDHRCAGGPDARRGGRVRRDRPRRGVRGADARPGRDRAGTRAGHRAGRFRRGRRHDPVALGRRARRRGVARRTRHLRPRPAGGHRADVRVARQSHDALRAERFVHHVELVLSGCARRRGAASADRSRSPTPATHRSRGGSPRTPPIRTCRPSTSRSRSNLARRPASISTRSNPRARSCRPSWRSTAAAGSSNRSPNTRPATPPRRARTPRRRTGGSPTASPSTTAPSGWCSPTPTPDAAIVDIRFVTADGIRRPSRLQGYPVPGRSVQVVTLGEVGARDEPILAAQVSASRGRVVVGRAQHYVGGQRLGFTMTLGAPSLNSQYYFADGETGAGIAESYAIYNPTDAEVTVFAVFLGLPSTPDFTNDTEVVVPKGGGGDPRHRDHREPARRSSRSGVLDLRRRLDRGRAHPHPAGRRQHRHQRGDGVATEPCVDALVGVGGLRPRARGHPGRG